MAGRSERNAITTAQSKLFGNRFPGTVRFMFVQAVSQSATSAAEHDITLLLRQRFLPARQFADAGKRVVCRVGLFSARFAR